MDNEIIEKILRLANSEPSEANIQHLLVLSRKLFERLTAPSKYQYARLYCDWVVHSKLDRGSAKQMIRRFHEAMSELMQGKKPGNISLIVSEVFSLDSLRAELNSLYAEFGTGTNLLRSDFWQSARLYILEIISSCPIEIPLDEQKDIPKDFGCDGIISVTIVKDDASNFDARGKKSSAIYAIKIGLTNAKTLMMAFKD